ncbi:hypothetical protein D3C73_1331170 [compost metagenome]
MIRRILFTVDMDQRAALRLLGKPEGGGMVECQLPLHKRGDVHFEPLPCQAHVHIRQIMIHGRLIIPSDHMLRP